MRAPPGLVLFCSLFVGAAGAAHGQLTFLPKADPARMEVKGAKGEWLATLTKGCQTVTLAGPKRTFAEATAADPVTHDMWVRTLPQPFDGEKVPQEWLIEALKSNHIKAPDILAMSMQYVRDAPALMEGGEQVAGDASYGPVKEDGKRAEGSDFNDYLGITVRGGVKNDTAEVEQFRCMDCSGFMRMIYGHRVCAPNKESVFKMVPGETKEAGVLPRRSVQLADCGVGLVIIPNTGTQATAVERLQPGDLIFLDDDEGDGTAVDHVAMVLGLDQAGHTRVISSRKSADGPTLGDTQGKSILDGNGNYAKTFRTARRL